MKFRFKKKLYISVYDLKHAVKESENDSGAKIMTSSSRKKRLMKEINDLKEAKEAAELSALEIVEDN